MRVQSLGDYYTLHGVATELGVSYWQVWRAIRQQQTPTFQLGQTLLVLLDDARQALNSPAPAPERQARGQVCPECGSAALVFEEGCQKCHVCGYAVC